jgi:hypothetical protein
MRYDYKIEADNVMVTVLNSLFASQHQQSGSTGSTGYGYGTGFGNSGNSGTNGNQWGESTFTYGYSDSSSSFTPIGKKTGEPIFKNIPLLLRIFLWTIFCLFSTVIMLRRTSIQRQCAACCVLCVVVMSYYSVICSPVKESFYS